MRVSSNCHCSSVCCSTSSFCNCLPCLRVSRPKDAQDVSSAPEPVSVVSERKLSDEKIVDGQSVKEEEKVDIFLKSSLKKAGGPKSEQAAKGRVKWMDLIGKELVEIKEFESMYVLSSFLCCMTMKNSRTVVVIKPVCALSNERQTRLYFIVTMKQQLLC